MNHSVRRWARYATTHGSRASCISIATVPEVHSATLLACIMQKRSSSYQLHLETWRNNLIFNNKKFNVIQVGFGEGRMYPDLTGLCMVGRLFLIDPRFEGHVIEVRMAMAKYEQQ